MSLFHELKRRKVFRVAVVYAATAFAVLQGADIILPNLGVPGWAMGFLVVLVLLGFPIALVLAWALEVRRQGVTDLWCEIGLPPDCRADSDTWGCGLAGEAADWCCCVA
jgi:hypothetical protein